MARHYDTIIPPHIGLNGPPDHGPRRRHVRLTWIATLALFALRRMVSITASLLIWPLVAMAAWYAAPTVVLGFVATAIGWGGGGWIDDWRGNATQLLDRIPTALEPQPAATPAPPAMPPQQPTEPPVASSSGSLISFPVTQRPSVLRTVGKAPSGDGARLP